MSFLSPTVVITVQGLLGTLSLMQPGRNRQTIEDLLQHKFSKADVETATQLLALREQLYPPGKLRPTARPTLVEHVEVHMGDKFSNISGPIINRSLVESSFNKVKAQVGNEAADVLAKAAELIEASGNRQAAELFEQFNEELQRPEPRKSVLSTAWDGIVKIVPAISSIAGAAAAISKLFA